MAFPIKTCVLCKEEFELKPDKPGFANRCPQCREPEAEVPLAKRNVDEAAKATSREGNEARRTAMKNLLYRKDS